MATIIHEPVSGDEKILDVAKPLFALEQFYLALNSRDMALMEQNWEAGDAAVMDNPLGGIKRGWEEIRSVYGSLFGSANRYHFEFYDYTVQYFGDAFVAIGRERGQLVTGDGWHLDLAIRTTRIFRWTQARWHQIHHHGSIDDPDMLSRYQQAVLKRAA